MKEIPEGYFGKSVHIDLYKCDVWRLNYDVMIDNIMTHLIDYILKMKRYGEPFLEQFGSGRLAGYSYCQMIETSCVSAHFAPESESCYIDVFSCKDYDEDAVVNYLTEQFKAKSATYKVLIRA